MTSCHQILARLQLVLQQSDCAQALYIGFESKPVAMTCYWGRANVECAPLRSQRILATDHGPHVMLFRSSSLSWNWKQSAVLCTALS